MGSIYLKVVWTGSICSKVNSDGFDLSITLAADDPSSWELAMDEADSSTTLAADDSILFKVATDEFDLLMKLAAGD